LTLSSELFNNQILAALKKSVRAKDEEYFIELSKLYTLYQTYLTLSFSINSNDVKVSTLEWTLSSPVEAHTFVVPPKVIAYGDYYPFYRRNYEPYRFYSHYNLLPINSGISSDTNAGNLMYIHVFVNNRAI